MNQLQKIQQSKIKTLAELTAIAENLKTQGEKIVFTNGCFDILHAGHLHTLAEAKALGTKLIVAVNSDTSIQKLKGKKRPIQNEKERSLHLATLAFVDYVILFEDDTPLHLIESIKPHILVKGGDYSIDQIVGAKETLAINGKVETIALLQGFSTTNTIQKILDLG